MRAHVVIAALTGIFGAGFGTAVLLTRPAPAPAVHTAPAAPSDETVSSLRHEVASLRSEVQRERLSRAAEDEPAESGDADDAPPPQTKREPRDPAELRDQLDSRMEDEPKDRIWSGEMESALANGFRSDAFPGSSLVEADCRSSVCRFVAAHDTGVSQADFIHQIAVTPPFNQSAGMARPISDENGTRTVVYLMRPGERLPARPN